jgi:hypothetical protein
VDIQVDPAVLPRKCGQLRANPDSLGRPDRFLEDGTGLCFRVAPVQGGTPLEGAKRFVRKIADC